MLNKIHSKTQAAFLQPGIAIGPILFVVAILAVIVGALAAGSSGFTANTNDERNRTLGGALIEQGTNMKLAFERLYGGAITVDQIVISPSFTAPNETYAIYSPTGGGILQIYPPNGTVPTTGVNSWRFVENANLPKMATAGANDMITVIGVANATMCKAINGILFGREATQALTIPVASSPSITLNDVGSCSDVTVGTTTSGCNLAANAFDISSITGIDGYPQACIDDGTGVYYYYQLLLAL